MCVHVCVDIAFHTALCVYLYVFVSYFQKEYNAFPEWNIHFFLLLFIDLYLGFIRFLFSFSIMFRMPLYALQEYVRPFAPAI